MDKSLKGRTFTCQFGPDMGKEFEVIQEFIGLDNVTTQVKMQHIDSTRIKYEVIADLTNPVYYTETTMQPVEDEDLNTSYEIRVKWADEEFATTFKRGVEIDYQDRAIVVYDENGVLINIINIDKVRYVTLRKK